MAAVGAGTINPAARPVDPELAYLIRGKRTHAQFLATLVDLARRGLVIIEAPCSVRALIAGGALGPVDAEYARIRAGVRADHPGDRTRRTVREPT